jgi:hypothetical protein
MPDIGTEKKTDVPGSSSRTTVAVKTLRLEFHVVVSIVSGGSETTSRESAASLEPNPGRDTLTFAPAAILTVGVNFTVISTGLPANWGFRDNDVDAKTAANDKISRQRVDHVHKSK